MCIVCLPWIHRAGRFSHIINTISICGTAGGSINITVSQLCGRRVTFDLPHRQKATSQQGQLILIFNGFFCYPLCAAAHVRLASSTPHDVHWFVKGPFRNMDFNLQDVAILSF